MASSIKRSIVIPCYNEEGNLKKLILSCQEHLCSNFIEVILVDNGSTDGSQEIISSLIGSNDFF